jgi:TonB family protein
MHPIEQLIRATAPAIVMAAVFAAPPAGAAPHKKNDPKHIGASADFKSCAKPVYPAEALKTRREGVVTLAFLVGADGSMVESKVEKSSGHADLDEAAHAALALCKFKPASQDGLPVREWTQVQYVWTLK